MLVGLFLSLFHQATFGVNGDVMSWGARGSLKRHLTPVLWIPPALLNQQVSLLNSQTGISGKFQAMDRYQKSYIYLTLYVSAMKLSYQLWKTPSRKKNKNTIYYPTHFYVSREWVWIDYSKIYWLWNNGWAEREFRQVTPLNACICFAPCVTKVERSLPIEIASPSPSTAHWKMCTASDFRLFSALFCCVYRNLVCEAATWCGFQ